MTIRSRLLLFLLPPMIAAILFVASTLSYYWYQELIEGFKTRLRSAIVTSSSMIHPDEIPTAETKKNKSPRAFLYDALKEIQEELDITHLYIIQMKPNINGKESGFPYLFHTVALSPIELAQEPLVPHFAQSRLPFFTREVFITPVYKGKDGSKIMTGYAPIIDTHENVIGVIAADVSVKIIDKKLHQGLWMIALSSGLTILLITTILFIIANKIAHPVQKLNNSALTIAGGQYGEQIQVKGPKEIEDLSNTLSTMSECLLENINRLKENSLLKEKMYGEYECALFLQNHMLQKVVDECENDAIGLKAISFFSRNPRGLLLDIPETAEKEEVKIHLVEAKEKGFEEMYELLTNYKLFKENPKNDLAEEFPFLQISLHKESHDLSFQSNQFLPPLIWSTKQQKLLDTKAKTITLEPGDLFFLPSSGLLKFFEGKEQVAELLIKVLKFFAEDGLEICVSMLQKELSFATKRKELLQDMHLLAFQLLY
jgi:hypothetical protein